MTRYSMFDRSKIIARSSVPALAVNPAHTLYDQSVAEQKVEQKTNAIVRSAQIALNPASTNGQYALPADFRAVNGLWFAPPTATNPQFYSVPVWEPSRWKEFVTISGQATDALDGVLVPQIIPSAGELVPGLTEAMIAMVEFGVLNVFPFGGATGTLTLNYKPHLTPYSPESPLWAAYAPDPEPAMRTNGLDDTALADCIDGIIQYCAAKMLRASPGGVELCRAEIVEMEANFERSIWAVASATMGNINTTPQRLQPRGARF